MDRCRADDSGADSRACPDGQQGSYPGHKSAWGRDHPVRYPQSEVVVHRLANFLLGAEVALSRLNGYVPK
jgi:hypothetical protein